MKYTPRIISRLRADESGSVLMETVIALPLYLTLIGGILWVGDLSLSRQKAVIADRYVAWNKVNPRHSNQNYMGMLSAVKTAYFEREYRTQAFQILPTWDPLNSWIAKSTGGTVVNKIMPTWTHGMLSTSEIRGQGQVFNRYVFGLVGRQMDGGNSTPYIGHMVLGRAYNDGGPKDWSGKELADLDDKPWRDEIYQQWQELEFK